jgi:hypothetical protein
VGNRGNPPISNSLRRINGKSTASLKTGVCCLIDFASAADFIVRLTLAMVVFVVMAWRGSLGGHAA